MSSLTKALKIISVFIIFILVLTSCKSILTRIIVGRANIQKDYKLLYKEETDQTIFFFPMVHLAKPEYYENCKILIDSLRQNGYVFYFENVNYTEALDSLTKDKYDRKVRSILGFSPFLSPKNNSGPAIYQNKKFVFQNYDYLGITGNDNQLDLPKNQIIDSIENKYGELELTECDYTSELFEPYPCESSNKQYKFIFTNTYRDPYIAEEVLKVKHKKIALLYGKMHWYFIYSRLEKGGYTLIEGKI